MQELFAHVKSKRHDCMFTKYRKGKWDATCSCGNMLPKTGNQQSVANAWKNHVKLEGERYEAEVFITEIK